MSTPVTVPRLRRRGLVKNSDDIKRFQSIDAIFRKGKESSEKEFSPYFVRYHRRLFNEPDFLECVLKYVEWWSDVLNLANGDILDVGCGFGIYTMMFSFFGAREVHGIDHNAEKIAIFKKILNSITPSFQNVIPALADGLKLNYDSGRFDAIFIKDVVSHVRDVRSFFDEMSRLLKPGGRILITDENNALEFIGKMERRRKWHAWEEGGIKPEDVRGGEPVMTYLEMRREDISTGFPEFDAVKMPGLKIIPLKKSGRDEIIDVLAHMTKGLWGDGLIKGVREILATGELRTKPEFPYCNPRTGEMMEREFNPLSLAKELSRHGFETRVIPPRFYTRKPLRNAIGVLIRHMHPVSIFIQPNFYILGRKQ